MMKKKTVDQLIIASMLVMMLCMHELAIAQQDNPVLTEKNMDPTKVALYKASPLWKDMMNDPRANFFEVKKAFQLFWEGKEMPLEEEDIIGEKRKLKNNFINRTFNARELSEQQERESLAFDCKKYRWWLLKTEPFIHDDGSIMSDEERLELWKKHYEELNEQ
jgi:hypothetical protein